MIKDLETERVTRSQAERWGPLFKYEPIPDFKSKSEAIKWRDREEKRWYEGYNGLSGFYYKYLTQYKLKDVSGRMIRPYWRDGDHFIVSPTTDTCIQYGKDKFTLKRREYGLSGWDGGFVPLEIAARNPGAVINMTSDTDIQVGKLMETKIQPMAKAMYDESELAWKKVFGSNATLWKPKTKFIPSSNKLKFEDDDMGSIIQGVQTSNGIKSAKNMEGDRIMYAFIDEYFKHPHPNFVLESADASRKKGFVNVGWISIGGSAGESSELGAKSAMDLWMNHEVRGIEIVFLPSTLCIAEAEVVDDRGIKIHGQYTSFMCNGWSLQDEAEAWIHKRRKALYSLADKTAYWQFVKAYPLNPDEIFEVTRQLGWTDEERVRWDNQKKKIHVSTSKFHPVNIQENQSSVDFIPNLHSPIKVLEQPIQGEFYIIGIDPIPYSGKEISEGNSDFAGIVHRVSTNTDVAYYRERSLDVSHATYIMRKLHRAYNNADIFIERDRGDTFIQECKNRGWSDMLVNEPYIWRPANQKLVHKGFMTRGKENLMTDSFLKAMRYYNEATKQGGIENIWDLDLHEQYFTFHVGNKDLASARKAIELYKWWLMEQHRMKKEWEAQTNAIYEKKVPIKRIVNGKVVVVYETLGTNNTIQSRFGKGYTTL
jgi:hypothetical protein